MVSPYEYSFIEDADEFRDILLSIVVTIVRVVTMGLRGLVTSIDVVTAC